MATIKRASLYIDGQKLAECSTSEMQINTNDDRQHGQEGVLGGTTGNTEVDFNFDMVIIVGFPGASKKVADAILKHKEVSMGFFHGGRFLSCSAKFKTATYKSDAKGGTLVGSFSAMSTAEPTES